MNPQDNPTNQTKPLQSVTEEIYKKNLELLRQRRRAEQLLYGISEAVFAVDKTHQITLFNHTIEKMLEKNADGVMGLPADEIIKLQTEREENIKVSNFCFNTSGGKDERAELQGIILLGPGDKRYYVNVKTSIITEGTAGEECLVTMVDITKERELEKTKDDFISVTSHELRTPMSIIKSYLWMLSSEKGGKLTDKQNEYINKATKGTQRMLELINDMLNISKIEQGRIEIIMEKIDLHKSIQEASSDFKIKTEEKSFWFKIETDKNISTAYADKNKLREILINLIGNSLKFTDKGGVTVKIEKLNDEFAKISVIDTGKGLEKDDMDKLFHKFGRLDNSYQTVAESGGTGLGLYIVKQLVENMGGNVGAYSDGKNKGSIFWFTLPLNYKEEKEDKEKAKLSLKSIKSLIQ